MINNKIKLLNLISEQKIWLSIIFIWTMLLMSCGGGTKPPIPVPKPDPPVDPPSPTGIIVGGDFSILKKMQDEGGTYKFDGVEEETLTMFRKNGYTYARLRLFHTPNGKGPVCNSLDYTIDLAKQVKKAGMKLLLNFHYSDTWADPEHQTKPRAWRSLSLERLEDSIRQYSNDVITKMKAAAVTPDMVQVGNEITTGMLWPEGKIYNGGAENWKDFTTLLKAGISGVKAGYGDESVPIMIHIDKGGDMEVTKYFFDNIDKYGVEYDVIGLSYYPWWHGKFSDLEKTLSWVSKNKKHDIMIAETAYYANGYYPNDLGNKGIKPFPSTEQGQYDFLRSIATTIKKYPKVKGIFYWKPDGLEIPKSGVTYLGRSLFDGNGNAYKGIGAWKDLMSSE